jgi:glutaredoxin-related protein
MNPERPCTRPIRYYPRKPGYLKRHDQNSMSGTDHLDAIRRDANSAPVVLFVARTTDVRQLVARLTVLGMEYRVVAMGMSDPAARERFHVLEEWTGHKTLPQVFVDGRFIGGPGELLAHVRMQGGAPDAGRWLGYAGLIPFVAMLLGFVLGGGDRQTLFAQQFIAWGALTLSFAGAVHWGLALSGGGVPVMRMVVSILPALLAWTALLMSPAMAAWLLLAAFVALRVWEAGPPITSTLPEWYRQLRTRLTAGVALLLLLFVLAAR